MNITAAHERLLEAARTESIVYYSELITLAGIKGTSGMISGALGRLLYDIVMAEKAKDKKAPMLSAAALPKDGNRPAAGFFELARELGRLDSTNPAVEDAFWSDELNRVYQYWQPKDE